MREVRVLCASRQQTREKNTRACDVCFTNQLPLMCATAFDVFRVSKRTNVGIRALGNDGQHRGDGATVYTAKNIAKYRVSTRYPTIMGAAYIPRS